MDLHSAADVCMFRHWIPYFIAGSILRRSLKSGLFLVAAVLLMGGNSAKADDGASKDRRAGRTRKLWGDEYSAACSARGRADLMRKALEKRMSASGSNQASKSETFATDADDVVQAYQDAIDRFPHTEIAAYCAIRLGGFYQQLGRFDEAAELLEKTAGEFAGTPEGIRVAFNLGLIHAQARNDQVEAIKWFARVPRPENLSGVKDDEAAKLYLSAQEQLIKCELKLGLNAQAQERVNEAKKGMPQFHDELDRFHRFETAPSTTKSSDLTVETKASNFLMLLIVNLAVVLGLVSLVVLRRFKRRKGGVP
jgi:tetratricopeptide (TPR) repeat protein